MDCSACGAENPVGARFCNSCGAPQAVGCTRCGNQNPPGSRFCNGCGGPLGESARSSGAAPEPVTAPPATYTPRHLAEKILASRSGLEGERKQVTILFADVVGSTELIRDLDPEEAQRLLDGAVTRMMDAVHRYEGTVSRVMGDGIMALFGAPIAHEDHAVRACYVALAMQDAVRRYAEEIRRSHGIEVEIRVGINSGEVVVRLISDDLHMDYTALGPTVHLASRMEQLARASTTRLTADTLSLVEGYVRVRALGPVPVKGLAEPVEAYELVGAAELRSRLQVAAVRGLTRFVGRETELAALHAALGRAQAGHGQVVALVGEPGVGKSRLVWEVTHSHRTQEWLVLESGSVSHGKATPWLPVVDLLKAYCRIDPRDDSRVVREKVLGKLLALDGELGPLVAPLLALLDQPVEDPEWLALDAPQRRRRTLDGVRQLLLRESRAQPLLLVFEDLHWLDSETQVLLDTLVDGLPAARVLLLVNYRPEYRHEWGSKTYYTQVRVDPLAAEGVHELLASALGDDPSLAPVTGLLIEPTAGNPFFLEECIRTLIETGALTGERGAYRLARPVEALRVPATVQAMLAARIDRLPPEEKRVLQTASVVGKDVQYELLREIADLPDDALRSGLDRLQAAEFLYETALFPELEYTFKHALTHDVAYGSLLGERRRELHGRIVDAVERLHSDRLLEHVDRLADHAMRAESWESAASYAWQAGRHAVSRSALRGAHARFEQALAALDRLPETSDRREHAVDIRMELRFVLQPLGEYRQALSHWQVAERLAEQLDDHRRLGQARAAMAQTHYLLGSHDLGVAAGEHALALADDVGDDTTRAGALWPLANNCRSRGEYRRASALQAELLALARRKPSVLRPQGPIYIGGELACTLAELGEFAEAVVLGNESVRLARLHNWSVEVAHALFFLGTVYVSRGHADEAITLLDECVSMCERGEIHSLFPGAATRLAAAYVLHGRGDEAVRLAERSIERATAIDRTGERSMRAAGLGEAYLVAGRLSEACHHAERARDIAAETGERGYWAWALRLLGRIAASANSPDITEAEAHYREALTLAERLEMRPLQAHCHLGLGKLYRAVGRLEEAHAELSTAVTMLRAMEMAHWLPDAEAELAAVTASVGHER